MRCIVHPDLDQEFFEEQIQQVLDKHTGEEDLSFTYIIHETPGQCEEMADLADITEKEDFLTHCSRKHSSSFRTDGDEYLAIMVDESFLQEDGKAFRGLVAHELAHTVHRNSGLEDRIEKAAAARTTTVLNEYADRKLTKEDALHFIRTVLSTAVFCLKDIFANTYLIQQGFDDEMEHYYYKMLDVDNFCPTPEFFGEETELEEIHEAIRFDLQLIPSWLPFEHLSRHKADRMKARIDECYKANIPETSFYIDDIRHLYFDHYHDTDRFINEFFDQILDSSFDLLDKKDWSEDLVNSRT